MSRTEAIHFAIHPTHITVLQFEVSLYEGESHENLKYILSRNLLNTKATQ